MLPKKTHTEVKKPQISMSRLADYMAAEIETGEGKVGGLSCRSFPRPHRSLRSYGRTPFRRSPFPWVAPEREFSARLFLAAGLAEELTFAPIYFNGLAPKTGPKELTPV